MYAGRDPASAAAVIDRFTQWDVAAGALRAGILELVYVRKFGRYGSMCVFAHDACKEVCPLDVRCADSIKQELDL